MQLVKVRLRLVRESGQDNAQGEAHQRVVVLAQAALLIGQAPPG
jgi:hypothetical protein